MSMVSPSSAGGAPMLPESVPDILKKFREHLARNIEVFNAKKAYAKVFYPMNGIFMEARKGRLSDVWLRITDDIASIIRQYPSVQSKELQALCKCWLTYVAIDVRGVLEKQADHTYCVHLVRLANCLLHCSLSFNSSTSRVEEILPVVCKLATVCCSSHQKDFVSWKSVCAETANFMTIALDAVPLAALGPFLSSLIGQGLVSLSMCDSDRRRRDLAVVSAKIGVPSDVLRFFVDLSSLLLAIASGFVAGFSLRSASFEAMEAVLKEKREDNTLVYDTMRTMRNKIFEAHDEFRKHEKISVARRMFAVIEAEKFPDFLKILNRASSVCCRLLLIDQCVEDTCDASVVLQQIVIDIIQAGVESMIADTIGDPNIDLMNRISVEVEEMYRVTENRVRSYDCWSADKLDRQIQWKYVHASLKRLREFGYHTIRYLHELKNPLAACRVAGSLCTWYFLPTISSSSMSPPSQASAGDAEQLQRAVVFCLHHLSRCDLKKRELAAASLDLFYAWLALLVSPSIQPKFSSRSDCYKHLERLSGCWFKFIAFDGFSSEVMARTPGGKDVPTASITLQAERFVDRERMHRDVAGTLMLCDLDWCLSPLGSKLPQREELIHYVFDGSVRLYKKNGDGLTFGKVAARVARVLFLLASDAYLRAFLFSNVLPALNKALSLVSKFESTKVGIGTYDSEAQRIETDLLFAAAEIHCSLWMCEQLKLMEQIKEEVGWEHALVFAFDQSQANLKAPESSRTESSSNASKLASCMALRVSRQLEAAKHLCESLKNLKKCDIQVLANSSGSSNLVAFVSNSFGLLGMVAEEKEARELQLLLAKMNGKANEETEAAIGLLRADPNQLRTCTERDSSLWSELEKNPKDPKAISAFVALRAERIVAMSAFPRMSCEARTLLAQTYTELRKHSADVFTAPITVSYLTSFGYLHYAAAIVEHRSLEEESGISVPIPMRLLVFGLKYAMNVLALPASNDSGMIAYMATARLYFDLLEVLTSYAYDLRYKRLVEAYSLVGWLIAVAMGLPLRGANALACFCQGLGLSLSDMRSGRQRLVDAFAVLYSTSSVKERENSDKKNSARGESKQMAASRSQQHILESQKKKKQPKAPTKSHGPKRGFGSVGVAAAAVDRTELVLNFVRPPNIFEDEIDDITFKIQTVDLDGVTEEGSSGDNDDVLDGFLKDRLDFVVKCGVEQYHSLTCACRSCAIEILVAGMKAAVLRVKITIARGKKEKVKETIDNLRYGEQKIMALCNGDLDTLVVPAVMKQSIVSSLLAVRLFDWQYSDVDNLRISAKKVEDLDFRTLNLEKCSNLPPDATTNLACAAFGSRVFSGERKKKRERVLGRFVPKVAGEVDTDAAEDFTHEYTHGSTGGSKTSPANVPNMKYCRQIPPAAPMKKRNPAIAIDSPDSTSGSPAEEGSPLVAGEPSKQAKKKPSKSVVVAPSGVSTLSKGGKLEIPQGATASSVGPAETPAQVQQRKTTRAKAATASLVTGKENKARTQKVKFAEQAAETTPVERPKRTAATTKPSGAAAARDEKTPASRKALTEVTLDVENEPVDMDLDEDEGDSVTVVPGTPPRPTPPLSARKTRAHTARKKS